MKRGMSSAQEGARWCARLQVVLVWSVLLSLTSACSNERVGAADNSRKLVEEEIQPVAAGETEVQDLGRPRLVVDWTLSMAGFVAPSDRSSSRFNRALHRIATALPQHQLYSYGLNPGQAAIDELLTEQAFGLGRSFEDAGSYVGAHNDDHLLFRALLNEEPPRPLVLVSDGVYSTPDAAGVQPVVEALDQLMDAGWSVGVLSFDSQYYGIPCDSPGTPGCRRSRRWFHSEARAVQGRDQFIPMACDVSDRPVHVFVLSPSTESFRTLQGALAAAALGEVSAALFASDDDSPFELSAPGIDNLDAYDRERDWPWFMLEGGSSPKVALGLQVTIDETFPVDQLRWTVLVERRTLVADPNWHPWAAGSRSFATLDQDDGADPAESELAARSYPPLVEPTSCRRDLLRLRDSGMGFLRRHDLATGHPEAAKAVNSVAGLCASQSELYCDLLTASQGKELPLERRRGMAPALALASVDAARRQRIDEAQHYLGYLELPGSEGAGTSPTASLHVLASDAISLAPNGSLANGAGVELASQEVASRAGEEALSLSLDPESADAATTLYRLQLVPRLVGLSAGIRSRSTADDSTFDQVHRTYRFSDLMGALATTHLDRLRKAGKLPTLYLTVYQP